MAKKLFSPAEMLSIFFTDVALLFRHHLNNINEIRMLHRGILFAKNSVNRSISKIVLHAGVENH